MLHWWSFLINTYFSQQIEVCFLYSPAEQNTIVVCNALCGLPLELQMTIFSLLSLFFSIYS